MTDLKIRPALSPRIAAIISIVIVFFSRLIPFPATDPPAMSFLWIAVVFIASVFPTCSVHAGIVLGFVFSEPFVWLGTAIPSQPFRFALLHCFTLICLVIVAHIMQRLKKHSMVMFWLLVPGLVVFQGVISGKHLGHRLMWIYLAASIITSLLLYSKNKVLKSYPVNMFVAITSGYTIWVAAILVLELDPDLTLLRNIFISDYLLMPLPVFNLEILIVSHLLLSTDLIRDHQDKRD